MKTWWRRIRAGIGMGLTWAAAWFVAGLLLARVPGFYSDVPFAILFAPPGFVTGVLFSGILVAFERRRGIDRMSLSRVAGWGAVSGLLLSGIFVVGSLVSGAAVGGAILPLLLVPTAASAACAAGTLALARRAERRELPGPRGSDGR